MVEAALVEVEIVNALPDIVGNIVKTTLEEVVEVVERVLILLIMDLKVVPSLAM
jgi:hypothetical protein